jgi:hypothetical protein
MQSSPASHHFLPLRSKYSTKYPIFRHLKLCSFLSMRYHVSHPYKTTGKIIVLCILIYICSLIGDEKTKDSELHNSKHSLNLMWS